MKLNKTALREIVKESVANYVKEAMLSEDKKASMKAVIVNSLMNTRGYDKARAEKEADKMLGGKKKAQTGHSSSYDGLNLDNVNENKIARVVRNVLKEYAKK